MLEVLRLLRIDYKGEIYMKHSKIFIRCVMTAILLFPIMNAPFTAYATTNESDKTEVVLEDNLSEEAKEITTNSSLDEVITQDSTTVDSDESAKKQTETEASEKITETTETSQLETTSSSSETTTSSSEVTQDESFKIDVWKEFAYTSVTKGEKLAAEDFKANITTMHKLDISTITFTDGEPDTSKIGRYTVKLTVTTTDGRVAQTDFGYLVRDSVATIQIKNVEYDIEKRKLSFTTAPNTLTYVTANSEPVTWEGMSDDKGFYTNTFGSSPTTIDIFVSGDDGSYSEVFHLKIPKDDKNNQVPLYKIGFDNETNILSGQTLPGISIQVFTEDGPVANPENAGIKERESFFVSDAGDGTFSIQLAKTYKTIRIELTDHEGQKSTYYIGSDENDPETSKEIAKNAKKLPQTGETSKIIFSVIGGLVVVSAIAFIVIRKRKQI